MRFIRICTMVAALFLCVSMSFAQNTSDATEQRLKALEEKIIELEGQIRILKGQAVTAAPVVVSEPQPTIAATVPTAVQADEPANRSINLGGAKNAGKALNPDISVIGDFTGAAGRNKFSPVRSLEMHESEIGLQAIIDPYARGDFFISFGEQGVNVEEGFITFTSLPGSFVVKAGKMRSAFGKVNTMHNHVLPWIDRPLVSENLVGGEDGINDAGISITRILPAPKGVLLEATGQLFRGDSADVFRSTNNSDVSTVAHLHGFKDINKSTNLDIGLSYARGHNDAQLNCTTCSAVDSRFITNLYGVDSTLRWKPLRRSIYHSFIGRSEFIWSQRQQPTVALATPGTAPGLQRAFGYYASADYQFARRWFAGVRYDHSDRSHNASLTDQGGSFVITYWPSEFTQIRGQYRVTSYDRILATPTSPLINGAITNEFRIQINFSLGAHGAHSF
jgi:hypothetical protein